MNNIERTKVEAILPLTFIQNALLFHSLSASNDQGFLHVKLDLFGKVNLDQLNASLQILVNRHDIFRSSIHWEDIKLPVQVVHKNSGFTVNLIDLSTNSVKEQSAHIDAFLLKDKEEGFNFNKAPVSRITVFQLEENRSLLIWSCHHLLLDGWSSANVIRELAQIYHHYSSGEPLSLPSLPSTKDYRQDLKRNNQEEAESFWSNAMKGLNDPTLVSKLTLPSSDKSGFSNKHYNLNSEIYEQLQNFTRASKLTINSVLQMAWSIVLSKICVSKDVVFGNIVSVRSPRLNNAELMCGLFTNMLPVRVKISEEEKLSTLGLKIQNSQSESKEFAFSSLDQIQSWSDWPGYLPLFDHIFVVENFPWEDIKLNEVVFSNFRSGITSTYPLTIVVKLDKSLTLNFIYDEVKISEQLIENLGQNLLQLLMDFATNGDTSVSKIYSSLMPFENNAIAQNDDEGRSYNGITIRTVDQPTSPLEHKLTNIWQRIFKHKSVGINDDFFELGGKSLLAVRLFQTIQKELQVNAPPIMILKYPTISKLASYLASDKKDLQWKSLIPLKVEGDRNPLFCLHAKGGYVFFYNKFASLLDENQPVYALQPRSLDGKEPMYSSIEEMASDYIKEIKTVQSKGPYSILATCFSNAVGLEMAQQLKSNGDELGLLCMVDAAPGKSLQQIISEKSLVDKVNIKLKQTKFYHESKKLVNKIKGSSEESVDDEYAVKHEKHLAGLFSKYDRKPFQGKITLIRSKEFEEMKRKDFHITDWLKIVSKENFEVITVVGNHQTFFLEPEVKNVAKEINKLLDNLNNVES